MGKRSNYERVARDYYPTPYEAVVPLLPHIPFDSTFVEPCAGDGRLANHLGKHGVMPYFLSDIEPQREDITQADAGVITTPYMGADFIITNPPWSRDILLPLLVHWRKFAPAWVLIDADFAHTKQAADYMKYCSKIVSVGRIKWIEGSKGSGKDNAAWYCFETKECQTVFYANTQERKPRSKKK